MAVDLSDIDSSSIALIPREKLAIFILSTYGEGDPSDNTAEFWNYLHQNSGVNLSNLRYLAFGLGNSNYKRYNRVVDSVTTALDNFGAQSLLPVCRADDANGTTEEDFLQWKDVVYSLLKRELHLEERSASYDPMLSVIEDTTLAKTELKLGNPSQPPNGKMTTCSAIRALLVKTARELCSSTDRHCLHLELDLSKHPDIKYRTGDHLAVWPINPDVEVDCLIKSLGLEKRKTFQFQFIRST